ncbi:PAS domain S-box protein [Caldimonas tepidiphila]|uniref:PAS domain S-box protein n=1 Tax=Caldimonas tepidiphila TaxID=2315841 RepID=UPI001472782A|nr:PAS domain S-box protein [Caldimonas tepidiphila]
MSPQRDRADAAPGPCIGARPPEGCPEARFRALADALPCLVFEADARGARTWSSEACAHYTGLTPALLAGDGWLQAVHPEDRAASRAKWRQAIDAGSECTMRQRLRRHDGRWRWHLVRAVPMRGASGAIESWAGSATDIDEMVRTEVALSGQERHSRFLLALNERLRELADPQEMMDAAGAALGTHLGVAQVGYGEIDETQTHVTVHRDWNDGRIGSVAGTWRMDDFGPDFVADMKAGRSAPIADVRLDPRTSHPGVLRAYEGISTRAILDVPLVKQGRMVAMFFVHHPEPREWAPAEVALVEQACERLWAAVERARAERTLAQREALLRAVLEALPAGVAVADADGRLIRENAAFRALWGGVPDTPGWQQYGEWPGYWPDTGRRIEAGEWAMSRALLQGETVRDEMVECLPFDGGPRRFLLNNAAPVRDEAGRVVGGVVVMLDVTRRKEAEQALRQSEERYRLLNRATNDVIWDWDLRTDRLDWNEAVKIHFGCTVEELGPGIEGWYARIHPQDRERVVGGIHAAIEHGCCSWSDEYRFRKSDGSYATFLDRGYIGHDAAGKAYRMIGSMLDLTQRRRAEEALRESEARFRLMSDAVPQIVWITDAEGRNEFVNRQWTDYTGLSITSATAAEIAARAIHPDDVAITLERFAEARRTGDTFRVEHRVRSCSGEYRWFLVRAEPYREPGSDRIVRWFGASIDIHDRKRAEEELGRREREFRTLADNTPEILSRFDRGLRHLFVSRAIERATGLKPEAFIGKTNRELGMPAELCDLWDEALRSVFEQGRPRTIEFRFETPDGPRHFAGQFVPEFGPSGEVEQVLGVIGDRTPEKAAAQALQEADRRKDEFLATLAHELRNPLAPIRTGIQILRLTPGVAQGAARTLETMERQIAHMVRMIDDLLDVSRISRGKVELRREAVALRSILDSAIEASQPFIEGGGHELRLQLPGRPLCLDGDPTRLAQVLGNLLNNAAKYTPRGGRIELSAEREGGEAVIRVRDNGIGIAPEMLPRVFEMFTQVPQPVAQAQGGLGIGLSLAKRLVEMHQGDVGVESAGLGHGATFTVRLPLATDAETEPAGPGGAGPAPQADAPRVLVVDDNVDAAETLAMMLGLLGHDTRTAHDGADALVAAREFAPAVVFCDIGMPGMNGYEVAARLRAQPAFAGTLLVALTGWGSEEDRRRALAAGFDAHLTKPVDIAAMQQLIAERVPPGVAG